MAFNPISHLPTLNPISLLRMSGMLNYNGFDLSQTPNLSGKVAVITGGQSGIGREITAQLLLHGISKVYILARGEAKYEDAKKEWTEKNGILAEIVSSKTEFVKCNLSDVSSVKKVADNLIERLDRLDILINNAALSISPDYTLSPQGIENVFATNHVGHYELTLLLLPLIEKTAANHGNARIVVTSSSLHLVCQEIDFSTLTSKTRTKSPVILDSFLRYSRSKLANILFANELAKRLDKKGSSKVYVNSYFPGNIPTDAMDSWKEFLGSVGGVFRMTFQWIGQSPTDGAATAIYLAASTDIEEKNIKGKYFIPIATEDKTSTLAEDKDLTKNLWYWTDSKIAETLGKGWQESGVSQT